MGLPILDPFVNFVSETLDVPFSKNSLTWLKMVIFFMKISHSYK